MNRVISVIISTVFLVQLSTGAEYRLNYSIPQIDISQEKAFQVEVDRNPDQYYGHPTTAMLEDGRTIYVVYPSKHASGHLFLKRSDDGGKMWSEHLLVPKSWGEVDNVPTIFRMEGADGKKRLILICGMRVVKKAVSEDDGKTWSDLVPISDWGGIVAMSTMVKLSKPGHYMALFHDYCGKEMGIMGPFANESMKKQFRVGEPDGAKGFIQLKTFTADGGLTWSEPEMMSYSDEIHLCEPGAITSPNGKQIAVLWRNNRRKGNSFITFSNDEGKTWTEPKELQHGALTGERHVAKYLPDGRLFVSFRDMAKDSSTRGDWVAWVGRYDDLVNGTKGDFRIRLMDNAPGWDGNEWKACDCAYPGVDVLPDGTVVTITYGKWDPKAPNYIMCVRLKVDGNILKIAK